MTYEQMPEPKHIPPGCEKAILHASIQFGQSHSWPATPLLIAFSPCVPPTLALPSTAPKRRSAVYALLAAGGEVSMPLAETFFANRFAMLRDKFGVLWEIIHERPMPASA